MKSLNLINIKEASQILNCSQTTIYRYIQQDKLKLYKVKNQYHVSKEELSVFCYKKCRQQYRVPKSQQFISMKDLKKSYSYYQIKKLVVTNQLKKINNRYYQNLNFSLSKSSNDANNFNIFYNVDVYIPNGVVCLYSAAFFYKLITYRPQTIQVAVPKQQKIYNLPIKPIMTPLYFNDKRYKIGIVKRKSNDGFYRIYDLEKTICDFFVYKTKLNSLIFTETIKNYFKHPEKDLMKLKTYAKQLKVWNCLKIYLQILT